MSLIHRSTNFRAPRLVRLKINEQTIFRGLERLGIITNGYYMQCWRCASCFFFLKGKKKVMKLMGFMSTIVSPKKGLVKMRN